MIRRLSLILAALLLATPASAGPFDNEDYREKPRRSFQYPRPQQEIIIHQPAPRRRQLDAWGDSRPRTRVCTTLRNGRIVNINCN